MELKLWLLQLSGARQQGLKEKEYVFTNSFSIKRIRPFLITYIPEDQQMVVKQSMTIEGSLDLDGELAIV